MIDEQNTPGNAPRADQDTSKGFDSDKEKGVDDYYSVDDPKKEVHSTIGDGEMHDEGLVGEGNLPDEDPLTQNRFQDDQDKAELRDNEG